jgi:hypothetical protein
MRFVALNAPPDLDVLLAGAPDLERLRRVASFDCALAFATWSGLKFVRRLRDRRG